jgi:hypothetical protein
MANAIIDTAEDNLHTRLHAIPLKRNYTLPQADRMSIRRTPPSQEGGPRESTITNAEIEAQRQTFIGLHGNDGLS